MIFSGRRIPKSRGQGLKLRNPRSRKRALAARRQMVQPATHASKKQSLMVIHSTRRLASALCLGAAIMFGTARCRDGSPPLAQAFVISGPNGQSPNLPDIPQPALDKLLPTVRDEIRKAHEAAIARPLDASANGKLGMVLHAYNLLQEAEVCYRRAHLLDPSSFQWAYYLGLAQMDQANCKEAIATLREALPLNPGYLPAQLRMGECLLVSLNWEEAGKLYETVLGKHPESAEAHYGLGRVRAARNELDRSVESFQRACELFPKFSAAHHALARAYQRLGKRDLAREELELAKKSGGALPEIEDQLFSEVQALYRDFNAYLKVGSELGGQGKLEDAAAAYEQALEINPQLPEAHARLIYLYGQLGQVSKAEQHYQAAVSLDPKRPETYFNYGVLALGQGKSAEAEQAFRKTLAINPRHAMAHNNLGYLLEGHGKIPEAAAEFQKALENDTKLPQAHFSLGRILVKQEDFEEGIPHLLKALATEDENLRTSYLHATAIAYADAGDLLNSLRYLRLARERAAARNQTALLRSIDEDLRLLEGEKGGQ